MPERLKLICLTALALIAWTLPTEHADAAIVTVGSPLTAAFESEAINNAQGTLVNQTLTEPGAQAVSPVSGIVVRWRLIDTKGPHSLRVVRPAAGGAFTGVGRSASVSPAGLGIETFPTNLPIRAGDTIGLDNDEPEFTYYGLAKPPGGQVLPWVPPLAEATSTAPSLTLDNFEIGFNADIQPAPSVTGLSPSSGVLGGGTSVVISGTDLEGAGAVSFGSTSAAGYAVDSESQITAVAPPGSSPGVVDVSVKTAAGTSPGVAADRFTYVAPAVQVPVPPTIRVKRNKRKGTATIFATVSGPGALVLSGKGIVKRKVAADRPGRFKLAVDTKGRAKKALARRGKAKVTATITFTPTGGAALSVTKTVALKKPLPSTSSRVGRVPAQGASRRIRQPPAPSPE
jgi:hypothetical protein